MTTWHPIDSAPRDGTLILAWSENDSRFIGSFIAGGWVDDYDNPCRPTYWQPLPPPPTEETTR